MVDYLQMILTTRTPDRAGTRTPDRLATRINLVTRTLIQDLGLILALIPSLIPSLMPDPEPDA